MNVQAKAHFQKIEIIITTKDTFRSLLFTEDFFHPGQPTLKHTETSKFVNGYKCPILSA